MKPRALDSETVARLVYRAGGISDEVAAQVDEIWNDVAARGDQAVLEWAEKLDGRAWPIWIDDWRERAEATDAGLRTAIENNHARILAFHERQRPVPDSFEVAPGVILGRRPVAVRRVGCYVPGGRASYPSTVLMTVTPARVAGADEIIVVTPCGPEGPDPAVCHAAKVAGATAVLGIGGAHAIAALALGTESVPAVDVIVGPGNAYVTQAKRRAAGEGHVRTDAPAGPSELLVLADSGEDAESIAWDLLAQAEHDPDAQVILVTPDEDLATAVAARMDQLVPDEPRADIITAAWRDNGAILIARDWEQAVGFADDYAAEHLAIRCAEPATVLDQLSNAGSVFLGPWAPVSLGDYGSGTNHVLPTMGQARLRGGLAVDDFTKWITWQDVTREGLASVAADVTSLADAEGLSAHASAVRRRLA